MHLPNIFDQVDEERQRIALGMKNSYMSNESALEVPLEQKSDEPVSDKMKSAPAMKSSLPDTKIMSIEVENDDCPIFSQAEARASIPPLDVTLEDFDQFDVNNTNGQNQEHANEDIIDEKQKRRAKNKAKEERLVQCP